MSEEDKCLVTSLSKHQTVTLDWLNSKTSTSEFIRRTSQVRVMRQVRGHEVRAKFQDFFSRFFFMFTLCLSAKSTMTSVRNITNIFSYLTRSCIFMSNWGSLQIELNVKVLACN